jgi:hypothetical protein
LPHHGGWRPEKAAEGTGMYKRRASTLGESDE